MNQENAVDRANQKPESRRNCHPLSWPIRMFLVFCAIELTFFSFTFGTDILVPALLLAGFPLIVALLIRFQRPSVQPFELFVLALILGLSLAGTRKVLGEFYSRGKYGNPPQWLLLEPPTSEAVEWATFEREMRGEPAFDHLVIHFFRGVRWVEGPLRTEADFDRLMSLARTHGVLTGREKLDGPYRHSISITVPGTGRAKPYH